MIGRLFQRIRFALSPPAIEVEIRDRAAWPRRGKVKRGFLEDCTEIAREHGIAAGRIFGVRRGGDISLEFSQGIPPAAHQRLRNAWNFHR